MIIPVFSNESPRNLTVRHITAFVMITRFGTGEFQALS